MRRSAVWTWLTLSLAGCGGVRSAPAPPEPQPAAADTVTPATLRSPIRQAAGVSSFEATGRLLAPPGSRAEITLPLLAIITALRVAPGETVAAGQLLAEVVVPEAARAQGQLEGARLRSDAHARRLAQLEQLRGDGLVRAAELAEARARLAEAQASAREASAVLGTLVSAGLRPRDQRYAVLAPMAGVVTMVNASLGSTRGPSDDPICAIVSGRSTRVEARFAFVLPPGAGYELWSSAGPLGELRLLAQSPEISPGDGTRLTWFDAVSALSLPHGSTVRVRLRMPDDSWLIPQSALRAGPPPHVDTLRTGALPIEVLSRLGSEVLVRGALRADDLVTDAEAPQ